MHATGGGLGSEEIRGLLDDGKGEMQNRVVNRLARHAAVACVSNHAFEDIRFAEVHAPHTRSRVASSVITFHFLANFLKSTGRARDNSGYGVLSAHVSRLVRKRQ